MSPLKKRPRVTEPGVISSKPTLESVNSLFTSVIDQVNSTCAVQDVRSTVLQLGEWQRHLYETVSKQDAKIATLTAEKLKASRKRMAADYERAHLQRQIVQCKQFAVPHLEQLAREEIGNIDAEANSQKIVNSFLGADVNDPNNKDAIVAKLQECLKQRALLERDLQIKKQALLKTQQELKAKQDFLRSLPTHLQAMERASQGLVKFMSNSKSASGASVQHMTGTERLARLELAQQLPAPLYTLYTLLQHYVDQSVTAKLRNEQAAESEDGKMKLQVIKSRSKDEVIFQLPVSDVGTAAMKRVSIHFLYSDAPVPVVTVHATGCATTLNQEVLLDELFPGDFALETSSATATTGKSYRWSNHLAGLYPIPSLLSRPDAHAQLNVSTRVVVHELQRRIRANATLKHVLYSLQRLHVPVPPPVPSTVTQLIASHDVSWKPVCKLVSFGAVEDHTQNDDDAANATTTFQVELRKGNKSLQAAVRVQTTRYPAVPPVWSFQGDREIGKSPLYDTRLAQLAQQVNVDALGRMAATASSPEDPSRPVVVDDAKLQYYEWILVHQLREVMLDWDVWTEDSSVLATIGRKRRGRDRKIV